MPYPSVASLPPAVRKKYSAHGQSAFRKAFNTAVYDEGKDESTAFAIAHSAAKRAEGTMGKGKSGKHPGFQAVQAKIAKKQGISSERAGAILASRSRNASASAKKKNPRLNRVKGKKSKGRSGPPRPSPIVAQMTRRVGGGGGDSDY